MTGYFNECENVPDKKESISEKTKQGILFAGIERMSGTFLQFLGSIALARLIAVEDFGLVQLGTMIVGFATRVGEFGLNMGIVQRQEEVSNAQVNTLFWLDFVIKLLIFAGVMVALPSLTSHFDAPRLQAVMPVIALYVVLDSFTGPGFMLLRRRMSFGTLSQIRVFERFIELVSAVTMAVLGFGVWSLIWCKVFASLSSVVWSARAVRWHPSLRLDLKGSRDLFSFGGWIFVRNIMRYAGENVDYYFVGKLLGQESLGHYTRAFDLMRMPQRKLSRSLNTVLFSAFARVQDQPEKVKAGFDKVVLSVSLASYPLLIGAMLIAPEFILFVYGEKWLPTVVPFQIMCVAGVLRSIDPFLNSVVTATGYVKHSAFRRFFEVILVGIASFIGASYGITGVSIGIAISSVIVMILMVNLLKRVSNIGWRDYLTPQLPAIGGSLVMAAVMLALRFAGTNLIGWERLLLMFGMTAAGAATYFGFLWLIRPPKVMKLLDEMVVDLRRYYRKCREWLTKHLGRLQRA